MVADKALLAGLYKYTSPVEPLPRVAIPVTYASPSASKVIPVPTFNPLLAVTIPIESIFVTSSYVNVPPIDTLPLNVPSTALTLPVTPRVEPLNVKFALSSNSPPVPARTTRPDAVSYTHLTLPTKA